MTNSESLELQAALRRLESLHHTPAGDLQRRFKRFAVRAEAKLWPGETALSANVICTGQVRDISRGGVGVLSSLPVRRGQFGYLQLIHNGMTVATLPAFCRYCQLVLEGAHLIGIEFGVETSIMMALGVPARELAIGDESESRCPLPGDFVGPESLLSDDAE